MPDVQPFRAVRYSGAAGPLDDLVAPPYDSVSAETRAELFTRSPFNVVHLTLPDSAREAGELYRSWIAESVLVPDEEPVAWILAEDFVGPDGVSRERHGVVVSLAVEPYEAGSVLPHERTHPLIREERLRLLRETGVHLEPIFLLADRAVELDRPERDPDLQVDGSKLWRAPALDLGVLADAALLIADGHHRYESALEYASEKGANGSRILALLVSTDDPGLHVFPTHRTFSGRPDLRVAREGMPCADLDDALEQLSRQPEGRASAIAYRTDGIDLVHGADGELDVELVDHLGLDGIGYAPLIADAIRAVDEGEADVAFILRAPRVEDVFALAREGRRLPPKSTYFFPKPLSGLLFHPVGS
jgi:uncharacterized protein (DUF1015 family)